MESYIWKQNIQALKETQSNINDSILSEPNHQRGNNTFITELSNDGSLIFYRTDSRQSLYFQSRQNPKEEAKAFVRSCYRPSCQIIILFGLEFGYIARELLAAMRRDQVLILVEPDWEVFSYAIRKIDLTSILLDERVCFHLYSGEEEFRGFIEQCFNGLSADLSRNNIATLITPPYLQFCDARIQRLVKIANGSIRHIRAGQNTIMFYADLWLENYIQNMAYFTESVEVESFFGRYRGRTAYLVAAGPSLDKNIRELKKVEGKGVIFTGYTSLRILLANGISPDFVVAIDGKQLNYENDEQQEETFDIPLIYSPMVDYRLLRKHRGAKISAVVAYDEYSKYLYQRIGKPYHALYAAGTVVATMLDIAYLFGCRPIVFVGQDLAYGEEQAYASGSSYSFLPGHDKRLLEDPNLVWVRDIYGGESRTSPVFLEYKRGLEHYIALKREEGCFLDATEGGVLIEGTEICTLKQAAERSMGKDKGGGIGENGDFAGGCSDEECSGFVGFSERDKDVGAGEFGGTFAREKGQERVAGRRIRQEWSERAETVISAAFQGLDEVERFLLETLEEIQVLPQRKREGLEEREYEHLLIRSMERCNCFLDEWNESTGFFRFSLMGRLYRADREAAMWREKHGDLLEAERLGMVHFYSSVLDMLREKGKLVDREGFEIG